MRVVRSLSEAPSDISSVVTIGNFDGFHRGHASIFGKVRERAGELGSQAVAITFDPHPLEQLHPDRAPRLITTLEQRIRLIAESGIDLLLIQSFNEEFSQLSPEQFIDSYLIGHFRARALCVGHNFRFGHRHRGNLETLGRWADRFELIEIGPVATGSQVVSSSRIRGLLVEGRVSLARRMLGRCHEIEGDVVTGAGRGRDVTVPTINLQPPNELIPCDGVYLTRITLDNNSYQDAVTNIGARLSGKPKRRWKHTSWIPRLPRLVDRHVCGSFVDCVMRGSLEGRMSCEIRFSTTSPPLTSSFDDSILPDVRHFGKRVSLAPRMPENRVHVEMFSRPGCHLCDEARDVIEEARTRFAFDFQVVNIDEDSELESAYGSEIPVVRINGNKAFKYRVSRRELERKLERLWNL